MDDSKRVTDALVTSRIFTQYASAFHAVTGLALCLETVQVGARNDLPMDEDKFPGIMTLPGEGYKLAVPVRDGANVVAVIRTGVIFENKTSGRDCLSRQPIRSKAAVAPLLTLLSIFAEQLGALANQLVLDQANCEPGLVVKAKRYIAARYSEPLHLEDVARHAHVSTYYLCKMFKKSTGMNFSNYVARVRIEAAKALLQKRNCRISEIALEVGFQSLTHFNRVFKRFIGESPRSYRGHLPDCTVLFQLSKQVPAIPAKKEQVRGKFGEDRVGA